MAKKRPASARRHQPTIVERFFRPIAEEAERVLHEAGLPSDVNHYVRWHENDRFTDDLGSFLDLQPGETAVAGAELARKMFGEKSEAEYAARILFEYRALCTNIRLGNAEYAMYLAARLGMLITEAELEPDALSRLQSLHAATVTHQQRTQERKARVLAMAVPLKAQHPDWSDSRIAGQIHQELKLEMEREADIGGLPELRTIRRYLRDL